MRVCPKCGYSENPLWQQDRFCRNLMYMRIEDFVREFPELHQRMLKERRDIVDGNFIYRLRKNGKYVVRREVVGVSDINTSKIPFYARFEGTTWSSKRMNREVRRINAIRSKNQRRLLEEPTE